jgi:hypothetical protein
MDDAKFDRLALVFAKAVSRRLTVALISGVTGMLGQQVARGFQLGPATCGEQGAVCTLVSVCCDGLTCVTSAINTSYGICVPGEGGMISAGTTLISPFSETVVEEVSALMETASTAPETDPQAEREARLAEIRARKRTGRTERKTRLETKRATVRTRKDENRDRQRDAREADEADEADEAASGPLLQLKLLFRKGDPDSEVDGDPLVPIEVVRVTNRDDVNVALTRIETIKGAPLGADLTTSQFTLRPGESYSFVSGLPTEDAANAIKDRYRWLDKVACEETIQKQGYRVIAAFSRGGKNHEFVVRCEGPHTTRGIDGPATARGKRKKIDEQKHNRNSQHQKKKKR